MSFQTKKPVCDSVEPSPGCIQSALCVLGDKWSPLLISQLIANEKTFGELETALSGISPRTLSARIEKLSHDGVITKQQYNDHPPRYKYQLTQKGAELSEILEAMAAWGEKFKVA